MRGTEYSLHSLDTIPAMMVETESKKAATWSFESVGCLLCHVTLERGMAGWAAAVDIAMLQLPWTTIAIMYVGSYYKALCQKQ